MVKKKQEIVEVEVEDATLKEYETNLLGGAGKFNLGDWIEFHQIGKISKIARSLDKPDNIVVTVLIKDDYYEDKRKQPKTHKEYQCPNCLKKHKYEYQASDCLKSHRKKNATR
jgi:hypothetical protein